MSAHLLSPSLSRSLKELVDSLGFGAACRLSFRDNPSGLTSAWLEFDANPDFLRFAEGFRGIGGRLATITVYRPDAANAPQTHELAYHLLLDGMPVTAKVSVPVGQALLSITPVFANADWEEREIMELSGIEIEGHPNPRRMFLDESIEAGVFDRYVPYSEITNAANHEAVWERIKRDSRAAWLRRQEEEGKRNA
jgi:NADH-quinone oxidoreductase subunit C